MRELSTVIDALLKIVPKDQTSLILALKDHQSSSLFGPPELQSNHWQLAAESLQESLGPPPYNEEWKELVYKIFTNEE